MMRNTIRRTFLFTVSVFTILVQNISAQGQQRDSLLSDANLANVIAYALNRQPTVQQALLDEEITELQIKSRLSEWYPQVNFNYLYQRNIQLQSSVIGGNTVRFGNKNNSALQFSASQAIFNRDVLLASRTRTDVRQQAKQLTTEAKIDLVSDVSKAFYDVIVSELNHQVANKNIIRQERSLRDTRAKYDAGVVDKTDYKRATIALNNSRALQKNNREATKAKTEYLKSLINYPVTAVLDIQYDSAALEREIYIDTLQDINYDNRIEYRILLTQRKLQEANVKYNRWSYLPSVSANGAYNVNYFNNSFSKLYSASFPQSFAGLTVAFPIFQGGKRKFEIRQSEWELKRTDLDIINLKNNLHSDYAAALSGYKSSLANYLAAKENVQLAQEVYDVIELQYQTGIKTYLEVAVAEADLSTSQINFFNALYQVMSRKIDVQRSLGQISY
jgi:outer membrane protein